MHACPVVIRASPVLEALSVWILASSKKETRLASLKDINKFTFTHASKINLRRERKILKIHKSNLAYQDAFKNVKKKKNWQKLGGSTLYLKRIAALVENSVRRLGYFKPV
jgi:hypothetical protein